MMRRAQPYGDNRNPELPWGSWLVVNNDEHPPLLDEHGRGWNSVRECFWVDRLGMPNSSPRAREQALEVLLSVLVAIDRQVIPIEESVIDLFGDSWQLAQQFFGPWLEGHGLSEDGLTGALTSEGKAVLKMLASTRGRNAGPVPIGLPVFRSLNGPDLGEEPALREAIMEQCESFATKLAYRFARTELLGQTAITFTGPPDGRNVPLARTLWSMSFEHGYERDRLYRWLINRMDRWEDWGEIARKDGAQGLTEHLLRLRFASEAGNEE